MTTTLTIHADERWELADGATLYDVTHLPCRAARYTPAAAGSEGSPTLTLTLILTPTRYTPAAGGEGSPATARASDFPVTPGGPMPPVPGCKKQDYAVVFVTAVAEE